MPLLLVNSHKHGTYQLLSPLCTILSPTIVDYITSLKNMLVKSHGTCFQQNSMEYPHDCWLHTKKSHVTHFSMAHLPSLGSGTQPPRSNHRHTFGAATGQRPGPSGARCGFSMTSAGGGQAGFQWGHVAIISWNILGS